MCIIRKTIEERKESMATGKALDGKPYAGNPHVRFDEGEVAPCTAEASLRRVHCRRQPEGRASVCAAKPRRGSLLYIFRKITDGLGRSCRDGGKAFIILTVCAFVSACAATTRAETDYSTWIYQTQSDTNSNPSSTSGYSFGGGSFWSSKAKPAAGHNYYVPAGINNFSSNKGSGTFTFAGGCLAVAGALRMKTGSGKTVSYPELRLLDGSYLWLDSVGNVAGKLTIHSCAESAAVIRVNYAYSSSSAAAFPIKSDLESDADAWVILDNTIAKNCTRSFTGDNSRFYGTMVIADSYATFTSSHFANFPGTLAYACAAKLTLPEGFPGTAAAIDGYTLDALNAKFIEGERYAALSGGTLAFNSARTFADLSIASNGVLSLAFAAGSAAVPTVTNSFSVASGAAIALSGLAVSDLTNMTSVVLLRLAGVAAENPPDVSGLAFRTLACGLPRCVSFDWTADGDDKVLVASCRPVSMLVRAPPSKANFFTNAAYKDYWSDGELPQSGRDYYIGGFGAITWELSAVNFAGESLTFENQQFYLTSASISAADMVINGLGSTTLYKNDSTWSGGLAVLSGGMYVRVYQGNYLYLRSTLSGSGPITISGTTTSSVSDPCGLVEFFGTNTAYSGRIKISTPISAASGSKPATPNVERNLITKCCVSDGRNFGGPFTADANWYNSVIFENFSRLVCRKSLTVDEPTRGFFINFAAIFYVPADATLTLNNPVTYNGELIKTGAGVLALGGRALFTNGAAESEPQATSNVLSVTEGSLKPLSPAATDGLDIRFSGYAGLILPATSATGLYSVRQGSAISADTASGKIPVSVDVDGIGDGEFSLRLATVADSQRAEELAAIFAVPMRVASHALESTGVLENADGTFSTVANYGRKVGLVVIIQ